MAAALMPRSNCRLADVGVGTVHGRRRPEAAVAMNRLNVRKTRTAVIGLLGVIGRDRPPAAGRQCSKRPLEAALAAEFNRMASRLQESHADFDAKIQERRCPACVGLSPWEPQCPTCTETFQRLRSTRTPGTVLRLNMFTDQFCPALSRFWTLRNLLLQIAGIR